MKNIEHEEQPKDQDLKRVHLFLGKEAEYIRRGQVIDEEEQRLLNLIKRDDIVVLSSFPITWEKLDCKKLGKFLSKICNEGAMIAYVA